MSNHNYFLILGIDPTADESAVETAFQNLSEKFKASLFIDDPESLIHRNLAMSHFRDAHRALLDPDFRKKHAEEVQSAPEPYTAEDLKPFLGHVCVAAGIISLDELIEAIIKQTDIDLPLGQILQERRLLSQTELDGMLMGQKLYGAPNRLLEPLTKRLLALGMVSLDMVKIVLIDQRTSNGSLAELMAKRGWISPIMLEALKS